jgi:hypothetical protein
MFGIWSCHLSSEDETTALWGQRVVLALCGRWQDGRKVCYWSFKLLLITSLIGIGYVRENFMVSSDVTYIHVTGFIGYMSVYRTTQFCDKISLLSLSYSVRCWMYVYWLLTCRIHYVLGKPSWNTAGGRLDYHVMRKEEERSEGHWLCLSAFLGLRRGVCLWLPTLLSIGKSVFRD